MKHKLLLLLLWIVSGLFGGCQSNEPQYDKPLAPGQLALQKINLSHYPDFSMAGSNLTNCRKAIQHSIQYLKKPSSQTWFPYMNITHQHALKSLEAFDRLLSQNLTPEQLNQAIRQNFDVYMSVGWDGKGTVLFTGYYTPIFDGSKHADQRYKYPLYKKPGDLVKGADGKILGRRLSNGQVTKYPDRRQITESGMLQGQELVWLKDPFEAYIAHVQGSAKIRTSDGQLFTVGYAANNGHDYHSIAKDLVNEKKIPKKKMSLSTMIDYFKRHSQEVVNYVNRNPRYVFFENSPSEPRGSLNEPVVAMSTIATDKSIYPRGCLAFIETTLPSGSLNNIRYQSYSGFVLDQDTGGAIRAPGRCDIYMGQGDKAGQRAGQTYQEGKLYYLFLKNTPAIQ